MAVALHQAAGRFLERGDDVGAVWELGASLESGGEAVSATLGCFWASGVHSPDHPWVGAVSALLCPCGPVGLVSGAFT